MFDLSGYLLYECVLLSCQLLSPHSLYLFVPSTYFSDLLELGVCLMLRVKLKQYL